MTLKTREEQSKLIEAINALMHMEMCGADSDLFKKYQRTSVEKIVCSYHAYKIIGRAHPEFESPGRTVLDSHYAVALKEQDTSRALLGLDILVDNEPVSSFYRDFSMDNLSHDFPETTNINESCVPFINQIQAGYISKIFSFRWEKLLIGTIISWAEKYRFQTISGITGEQAYEDGKKKWQPDFFELTPERAHMRYDVTFKRMGFKKENGIWRLPIQ